MTAPDAPDALRDALLEVDYFASDDLATLLHLAVAIERPLLLEGPAGVGKTEIARAAAAVLGRDLVRLQCYEGLDESHALYEWAYARQLLYSQLLRSTVDARLQEVSSLSDALDVLEASGGGAFFDERFLLPRPILTALTAERPTVLLIDEIDRADAAFEAFLLEVLSEFQVTIPELGTIRAAHRPLVILTSNATRRLSEALRRRCLFHVIDYPDADLEAAIIERKVPDLGAALRERLVKLVQRLRDEPLSKVPSVAESLDWAAALVALGAPELNRETIRRTLGAALKERDDLERIRRRYEG